METKLFIKKAAVALVALAAMVPATMSAYDFKEGDIYYDVNGTQVTVTREGENVASYSGDVVIPATVVHNGVEYTVTAICNGTFSYCHNLTSIEIPNTIVRIEHHAFRSCEKLQSVVIPNSVTSLGRCVFHSCSGLKRAVIGNSVPIIDEYCFQYCYELTDVVRGKFGHEVDGHAEVGKRHRDVGFRPAVSRKIFFRLQKPKMLFGGKP